MYQLNVSTFWFCVRIIKNHGIREIKITQRFGLFLTIMEGYYKKSKPQTHSKGIVFKLSRNIQNEIRYFVPLKLIIFSIRYKMINILKDHI